MRNGFTAGNEIIPLLGVDAIAVIDAYETPVASLACSLRHTIVVKDCLSA